MISSLPGASAGIPHGQHIVPGLKFFFDCLAADDPPKSIYVHAASGSMKPILHQNGDCMCDILIIVACTDHRISSSIAAERRSSSNFTRVSILSTE